jgi:oligosaccharyltransferase complex subunit alpha (ribophorin I)
LFEGNAYFDSPFTSKKQKTSLKLPSVTVHSHTKNPEPALLNKNILTYGPYSDIEANKESTVKVHYDSSKPYIYATEAHRDIELNHWTKDIWVEENYSITNKGPKLTGEFSRVTHAYSKMQALNTATYLESLEMDLPFDANEAYFRDQIGNVSTSNFRLSKSKSKSANFKITPRYPIYGGWKYTWYQGYHLNLFNHVSEASSPDTYTLSFPLLQNFVDAELPIEKFSWRLILPERAELISYDISLPGAKIETIRHYGLLDSVGRTSLLITVDNIGDFSQSQLTFTYQYTFFAMIQKPLVALSFAFGFIALAVIAYNGLSSLKLDSKKKVN